MPSLPWYRGVENWLLEHGRLPIAFGLITKPRQEAPPRRPRPLKPERAAREAFALTYSVPAPYVMMQLVIQGKETLLQLYTD